MRRNEPDPTGAIASTRGPTSGRSVLVAPFPVARSSPPPPRGTVATGPLSAAPPAAPATPSLVYRQRCPLDACAEAFPASAPSPPSSPARGPAVSHYRRCPTNLGAPDSRRLIQDRLHTPRWPAPHICRSHTVSQGRGARPIGASRGRAFRRGCPPPPISPHDRTPPAPAAPRRGPGAAPAHLTAGAQPRSVPRETLHGISPRQASPLSRHDRSRHDRQRARARHPLGWPPGS